MDNHDEDRDLATSSPRDRRLGPLATLLLLGIVAIATSMIAAVGLWFFYRGAAAVSPGKALDLTRHYHTPASQFVNGQFPWGEVPRGAKTFGNVPLVIDGAMYLWGASNAKNGLVFPERIDGIDVVRKFDTLYVYHGAFFSAAEGAPVYRLTMHYTDGTSSEHTIRYGDHVRDWYESPTSKTTLNDPQSQFVWRANHPKSKPNRPIKLRFSITSIVNPKPTAEVSSISLASAKGNSAGCILAMTTGPAGLLEAEPEDKEAAD